MRNFFTKELQIGLVGVTALVLFYLLVNFLKGVDMFKPQNYYYVDFPDVCQLTNSSPVYVNGYNVGNVGNIEYDYNSPGNIIVKIDVNTNLKVPIGSIATITTHMIGGTDINLNLGQGSTYLLPGDTLRGVVDKGIAGVASESIIPQFTQMLPKIDTILVSLIGILSNPSLNTSIDNVAQLTSDLSLATTNLNKILSKDVPIITDKISKMQDDFLVVSGELREIEYKKLFVEIDSTLSAVREFTAKLNSNEGTVGLLMRDPSLYNNLNRTCEQAASLLENLQENPKRYVHFSLFGRSDKTGKEKK